VEKSHRASEFRSESFYISVEVSVVCRTPKSLTRSLDIEAQVIKGINLIECSWFKVCHREYV
jgi:hypothetical protein